MSILGTLIDQVTGQSWAGVNGGLNAASFHSHIHSLPATTPNCILPVLTSVQVIGGNGTNGSPQLLACGGNASVVTIGLAFGSGVTRPGVAYDVTSIVFHSVIR